MNRFLKCTLFAALFVLGCNSAPLPNAPGTEKDWPPKTTHEPPPDPGPPGGLAIRVATLVKPAAANMFDAWNGKWLGPAPPKATPIISLNGSSGVRAYLPSVRDWPAPLGPIKPGSSSSQSVRLAGGGDGFVYEQEQSWDGSDARSAFVPFASKQPLWRRDDAVLAAEPDPKAAGDWAVVVRGALVRFSPSEKAEKRDRWRREIPMVEKYGWQGEIYFPDDATVCAATWRNNQARSPVALACYAWDTGAPRWVQSLTPGKLGAARPIEIVDATQGRAPVIDPARRPLYAPSDIVVQVLLDGRGRYLTAALLGRERGEVSVLDQATGTLARQHLIALPQ